jgi:uncharacterized membrane protein
MKHIKTIVLGVLALFFGVYAMALELNGIKNLDQVSIAVLFGCFTFLSTW